MNLLQSPRKKAEVIKNLASKYQIRIQLKETRGRPRKNLSDNKKAWLIEVLGRSDLTYTNPGRADNVYIRKIDGERQYLPRQYLLWSFKDLHDILNKQYIYNKNIPHTSCLCDTCEKSVLLAKGINTC